jgi:hypothetical protein
MVEPMTSPRQLIPATEPAPDKGDDEDRTIEAVMKAAESAFNPHGSGNRPLTLLDTIRICAALIEFLKVAGIGPPKTFAEWRGSIENLNVTLGRKTDVKPAERRHGVPINTGDCKTVAKRIKR